MSSSSSKADETERGGAKREEEEDRAAAVVERLTVGEVRSDYAGTVLRTSARAVRIAREEV